MHYITDTVDTVLATYFERNLQVFLDRLSADRDERGLKVALEYLSKAINSPENEFKSFIAEKIPDEQKYDALRNNLAILARLCRGDLGNEETLRGNCERLVDTSQFPDLNQRIGRYFKDKSNEYLQEKYPDFYPQIKPSTTPQSGSAEAVQSPSQEATKL